MTSRMPPEAIAAIFGLNERQALFVYFYLDEANYNATRAALLAGYSPKHPRQSGHQAMRGKGVRYAVDWLFEQDTARMLAAIAQR